MNLHLDELRDLHKDKTAQKNYFYKLIKEVYHSPTIKTIMTDVEEHFD